MLKKILLLAFAASAAFSSAFAADDADDGCTVSITPEIGLFSGDSIKPLVTQVICGTQEINGDNYTTDYGENINAGTGAGSVFVTIKGNTVPIEKKFTIGKKSIKIQIDNAEKEKGDDDPEFTWQMEEVNGVNADSLENLKEGLLKYIKLTRTAGEDIANASGKVIKYPIVLAEGVNKGLIEKYPNYTISVKEGEFVITKTKVKISAKNMSKVYGEKDPKLEYEIKGNVDEADYDLFGISLTRECSDEEKCDNVGTYTIKVAVKETETTDYIVEDISDGSFEIQPATVKVTADPVSKNYGDATPELTFKIEGLIGDDVLEDVVAVCSTCDPSGGLDAAGEYEISFDIKKEANPNYEIVANSSILTVSPRPVTVTVVDAEKTYGDKDPKFELKTEGLVEGESLVKATITRAEGDSVGTYDVDVAFAEGSNSNYELTVVPGKLTITPKAVVLTTNNVSKKFGVLEDPELTYKVDSLVGKDKLAGVVLSREKGENSGTYAITATVDAKANPNYKVTVAEDGGVFTIVANDDKIVVTITGNVDTVTYDGKDHVVNGFKMESNSEAYSLEFVSYEGDSTVTGKDAGTYKMGLSAKDFVNTSVNYPNVTFKVTDGSLLVNPKALVVTAKPDTITYGDATPEEFVWTVDSLLKGDTLDNIHVSISKKGILPAGKYALTFDKKSPTTKNYVVSEFVTDTLVVNRKLVTITVADTSKAYGEEDPEFSYKVDGLLEGDSLVGVSTAREEGENVLPDSSYRITVVFASDDANPNYLPKIKPGHFKITPYMDRIQVNILGDEIIVKYTGETITVPKTYDVIARCWGDCRELDEKYAYSADFIKYNGDSTISGTIKYLYPMRLKKEDFENISPNFKNVDFVVTVDGTLVINDEGPRTGLAVVKTAPMFSLSSVGRSIQVSGSTVGANYAVLDMQGRIVRKGVVASANFGIPVPNAGVYMVRVGASAKRIRIK